MNPVLRIVVCAILLGTAGTVVAQGASYLQVIEPASGATVVQFSLLTENGCQRVREQMSPQQQQLARCSDQSQEDSLPWKSTLKNEQLGIAVQVSTKTREICDLLVAQTRAKNGAHPEIISDCAQ
ncbi:hypothetical protein [Paludibacterium yongneupense]|uniref:hypothetical protein n=1 Tax=Paludibacterium yongneupense TaxID=400061 RepID=UPI00040BD567|nr:hypothetical protein [Paludibacterium yongneupense]